MKTLERILSTAGILCISIAVLSPLVSLKSGNAAEPADSFSISVNGETNNVTVIQNQTFSVRVEALTAATETATDYTGTVTFSSSDVRATLPTDAAFETTDLGKKDFDLGFKMIATGEQTITVMDVDDNSITGELTVTVSGSGTGTGDAGKPVIETPTDGTILNTSTVTVSGTAEPLTEVTVLDGTEKIGSPITDDTGVFTFKTPTLFDGTHTFTAQAENADGDIQTSDAVQIVVDTTSAVIRDITLTPPSSSPQGIVGIIVQTEPGLSLVEALVDRRATILTEENDTPGIYSGELTAPQTVGTFPVDIRVTDQNQNTQTYENQAELTVTDDKQPPTVTISATPSGGIAPLSVAFTSVAQDTDGFIKTYAWDFGDSGTSSQPNPNHIYTTPGSYSVVLTVTDDDNLSATARLVTNIIVTSGSVPIDGPGTWMAFTALLVAAGITFKLQHPLASQQQRSARTLKTDI